MNEIINAEQTAVSSTVEHQQYSVFEGYAKAMELASVLCKAGNIPANYQNKPADCMVAIEMANRIGVSPMFVFQNMYVVKGKPSWSGQACKALIDNCGKYGKVNHVYFGDYKDGSRGCYIEAVRVADGTKVQGPAVTMQMAQAEGWINNSKWKSMPELMLGYRAAAFFARIHCPEALMGLQTEGEGEDIANSEKPVSKLTNALRGDTE